MSIKEKEKLEKLISGNAFYVIDYFTVFQCRLLILKNFKYRILKANKVMINVPKGEIMLRWQFYIVLEQTVIIVKYLNLEPKTSILFWNYSLNNI